MEPLLVDGLGVKLCAWQPFGMWLAALQAWGYHVIVRVVLILWLAHLLEYWNEFHRWSCSRWPPHILWFSLSGIFCKFLRVWKSLLLLVSPSLVRWVVYGLYFTVLYSFLLLLIRMDGLHRGSTLPCLDDFGFPDFGSRVGVHMACLCVIKYCLWYVDVIKYCFWIACIAYRFQSCRGQVYPIWQYESSRVPGLVWGRWRRFNAWFFGFK